MSKEELEKIREKYEVGLKVKLLKRIGFMPPPLGTIGVIKSVSDNGDINVIWNDGSSIPVRYGIDTCEIVDDYRSEAIIKLIKKQMQYLKDYDICQNFLCVEDVKMEAFNEDLVELGTYIVEHETKYIEIAKEFIAENV